jgi:hypothetical protein
MEQANVESVYKHTQIYTITIPYLENKAPCLPMAWVSFSPQVCQALSFSLSLSLFLAPLSLSLSHSLSFCRRVLSFASLFSSHSFASYTFCIRHSFRLFTRLVIYSYLLGFNNCFLLFLSLSYLASVFVSLFLSLTPICIFVFSSFLSVS